VCFKFSVRPIDGSSSYVDISYTFTNITPTGEDFIDNFTEEKFLAAVRFWGKSMTQYLETGNRLRKA